MKRILVIEDDPDIVELLRYNLDKEGFEVEAASDGESGLRLLRSATPFDLLILDLMLPQLSGLEVCKEARKDPALEQLAIIMLTARAEEMDRVIGLEIGADDYVSKPFDIPVIIARVNAAVRNKVLHDQLRQRNFLLRDLTYTDELTGLRNRRFFDERIDEEIERAQRYGHPLTCLAIKADNCDEIEHRMGAESGRDVIAEVAMVIRSNTRSFDIVVSYDTHLFAIALPHTSIKEGLAYGKKIQDEIGSRVFLGGPVAPV